MKKHKTEFAALSLLLVVLCYAYYDSNIKNIEQDIVITNELLTMSEIERKESITMEMLSLSNEITKDSTEIKDGENIYSINLAATSNSIPYNEIISNQIVNYALNFVGNPYVYGGNSLINGTDCSGFTKLIYAKYGISLARSALDQSYNGTRVGLENIMPGDLVFSGYDGQIGHVLSTLEIIN